MAREELDLDVEEGAVKKEQSGNMKLVIIALVAVILVGGATVATLFFTGVIGGKEEVAQTDGDGEEQQQAEAPKLPQVYYPLEPPFVVNFGEDSDVRFMQIKLQVATRDPEVIESIKEHSPAIRNNLVMLYSNQDPADLNTREGKETLRQQTLAEVEKVLEEQTGAGGVENVYFTSFVMQ